MTRIMKRFKKNCEKEERRMWRGEEERRRGGGVVEEDEKTRWRGAGGEGKEERGRRISYDIIKLEFRAI